MSLLDSIFGNKPLPSDSNLSLFEHKTVIPEPSLREDPFLASRSNENLAESRDKSFAASNHSIEKEVESDQLVNDRKKKTDWSETADAEARTIFVGNLPLDTTRKCLAKFFKNCGTVESTRIRSAPVAGVKLPPEQAGNGALSKKVSVNKKLFDTSAQACLQGYVVFKEIESVANALALNNELLGDRHIRVDTASPTFDAKRSVFVGNLPYEADEESLKQHFLQRCNFEPTDLLGVRIVRDKDTFRCRGFGYVLLENRAMVATALQRMHGSTYRKKQLRVMVCGKKFKTCAPKGVEQKNGKETSIGALRRILEKENPVTKNRRVRGVKAKSKKPAASKAGVSKRAAAQAKAGKRIKKIKKAISKSIDKKQR